MSLKIYTRREDVPAGIKIVDINDMYFRVMSKLPDTEFTHRVLRDVEGATRVNDLAFKGKFMPDVALFSEYLSTGTKTLLNIAQHPDVCFNVLECGGNALQALRFLTEGIILWEVCGAGCLPDDKVPCDVILYNTHFDDFNAVITSVYYRRVRKLGIDDDEDDEP